MRLFSPEQKARLMKLIDQADQDGVATGDIVKILKPFMSRAKVMRLLKQLRESR